MRASIIMLALAMPAMAADPTPEKNTVASFPPGEGAELTQRICTQCHAASLIVTKHFDEASATRFWRIMIGTDPTSDEARKVIAYLSTVLGESDGGPDSALR